MAETRRGLHDGPALSSCSRCGGLVCANYCGRCGERLSPTATTGWFQVQLESTSRRTAVEAARLERYPGPVEHVGARTTVTVESPRQIDWLRNQAPRLLALKNSLVLLPGGRAISPSDPVFACLMGVMESAIRGCMTLKARQAHCAFESTLLPLNEPMKSYSLADQLESAGRPDLARALVLGVLGKLHQQGQKVYCPLFGRALRLTRTDGRNLPYLLAEILEVAGRTPAVFALDQRESLPVDVAELAPESADAQVVLALAMRQRTQAVHPRSLAGYESVQARGPALLFRYCTDVDQRMVDFMVHDGAGQIGERISLQADDVDLFDDGMAVLRVDRRTVSVSEHLASGDQRRCYVGGAWPGVSWQICRWREGWYWVWNEDGAAALLGPDRGWLLTSSHGVSRGNLPVPSATEFNGVLGATRCGDHLLVLSAGGHRLTLLTLSEKGILLGDPPLRTLRELLLQQPARGMCAAAGGKTLVVDQQLVYALCEDLRQATRYGPVEPGAKVFLLGGKAVFEAGHGVKTLGLGQGAHALTFGDVQRLVKRAAVRSHEGEPWGIVDRQGRAPHKSTWGG